MRVLSDWTFKGGIYQPKPGEATFYLNGSSGAGWYYLGEYKRARHCWLEDLRLIALLEEKDKVRYHKGWWYFELYQLAKGTRQAKRWLRLARQEDVLTYGEEKAKDFPAWLVEE